MLISWFGSRPGIFLRRTVILILFRELCLALSLGRGLRTRVLSRCLKFKKMVCITASTWPGFPAS